MSGRAYSSGTFDCFSDMEVCMYGTCCSICQIYTVADGVRAEILLALTNYIADNKR
jgi:Cys-rich protein (TIGR01571 family)